MIRWTLSRTLFLLHRNLSKQSIKSSSAALSACYVIMHARILGEVERQMLSTPVIYSEIYLLGVCVRLSIWTLSSIRLGADIAILLLLCFTG